MPHLCRPADHHEIGVHRARDAGQGARAVADFPDEGEGHAEIAGLLFGFVFQLPGVLLSGLLGYRQSSGTPTVTAATGSIAGVTYTATSVPLARTASAAAQENASQLVGEPSSPTTIAVAVAPTA
jgi:hypothetical protein